MKIYKSLLAMFVTIFIFIFSGCKTGNFSSEGGKEDVAYLFFASRGELAGEHITVNIDNGTPFDVKVQKDKKDKAKWRGHLYSINPGNRKIIVTYKGKILIDKQIFVSTQQTKQIDL